MATSRDTVRRRRANAILTAYANVLHADAALAKATSKAAKDHAKKARDEAWDRLLKFPAAERQRVLKGV